MATDKQQNEPLKLQVASKRNCVLKRENETDEEYAAREAQAKECFGAALALATSRAGWMLNHVDGRDSADAALKTAQAAVLYLALVAATTRRLDCFDDMKQLVR